MEKYQKAFDKLYGDCLGLYFNDTLVEYGLTEQQILEIVSGITQVPQEKLVELKQKRQAMIKLAMEKIYTSHNEHTEGLIDTNNPNIEVIYDASNKHTR